MVSLEDRFFRTQNGNIYSNTIYDYSYWKGYLQLFDEVIISARVLEIGQEKLDKPQANGTGVSFSELPYYVGPFQYLRVYNKLGRTIKRSVQKADAFILRIPGPISTRLWHHLEKLGKPYGVEVIGDSADSVRTAGGNIILRCLLKATAPKNQRKQCQNAVAAAYVSEFYLQQKYPPGYWSIHYSAVDLPNEAIITGSQLEQKIISFKDVVEGKRPLRICHAGTMEVAYKAQDILLEAVSISRTKGLKIELNLLGDGRLSKYYKSKVVELGIEKHVSFSGMLPAGDAVRKQLDMADIFILPSLTEGLPSVIVEAMARGLPCIGSNVGAIPELLPEKYLVKPGNAKELSEKIMSLITNTDELERMSSRNLEKAKEYCWSELNKRRIEFYKKVADEAKNRKH